MNKDIRGTTESDGENNQQDNNSDFNDEDSLMIWAINKVFLGNEVQEEWMVAVMVYGSNHLYLCLATGAIEVYATPLCWHLWVTLELWQLGEKVHGILE